MNDARKAGLDYRLIDPEAKDLLAQGHPVVEHVFKSGVIRLPTGGRSWSSATCPRPGRKLVQPVPERSPQEEREDDALGFINMDDLLAASGNFPCTG